MDVVECAEGDKTIVTTCTNLNKPELKDQCSAANGCKWMESNTFFKKEFDKIGNIC